MTGGGREDFGCLRFCLISPHSSGLLRAAMAQERGADAALGALSSAVVLGPIGAVAGAVVGYTAGPSIARSWGFRRSSGTRHVRRSAQQETRGSRADPQRA